MPHELNYRLHPDAQKSALEALYREVGFARSLLAYELPDGRLKLIDGHLRRGFDPNMLVDVEILDVTEDEARALLLSIDPLAALAQTQEQLHDRLLELAPPVPPDLQAVWQSTAEANLQAFSTPRQTDSAATAEQFLILVKCRDEQQQVEWLRRFQSEGMECRALIS